MDTDKLVQTLLNRITMLSSNTFSITFFVKKHRASHGEVPIYVRITVDGKRVDLSIKRKVALDRWDESRGTAKGNRPDVKALNAYLEQVRNKLYDCQQQLERERKLVTAELIKSRYLGQDERGKTLKEIIEYHNEEMKDELAWGTQKNYHTTHGFSASRWGAAERGARRAAERSIA